MNDRDKEKWKKVRSKGSFYFCMTRGIGFIGLVIFPVSLSAALNVGNLSMPSAILASLLASGGFGYVIAGVLWSVNESRCK